MLHKIPPELTLLILSHLPLSTLSTLQRVSRQWKDFIDKNESAVYLNAVYLNGWLDSDLDAARDNESEGEGSDRKGKGKGRKKRVTLVEEIKEIVMKKGLVSVRERGEEINGDGSGGGQECYESGYGLGKASLVGVDSWKAFCTSTFNPVDYSINSSIL
jgi:hypothetical protein